MDALDRSHRRAVWLIAGLLLVAAVGVVGYELNWVRERREARAELDEFATQVKNGVAAGDMPFALPLPARGAGYIDEIFIWALNEHFDKFGVPCPMDDANLLATFKDGTFPSEAVEELEQVRRARWLFPEAEIMFLYFTDADSNLIRRSSAERRREQPPRPLT